MLFETPEQMWKRIMFVYENLKLMHSLQRLDSMPGMMIQCLDRRLITTAIFVPPILQGVAFVSLAIELQNNDLSTWCKMHLGFCNVCHVCHVCHVCVAFQGSLFIWSASANGSGWSWWRSCLECIASQPCYVMLPPVLHCLQSASKCVGATLFES